MGSVLVKFLVAVFCMGVPVLLFIAIIDNTTTAEEWLREEHELQE